jgi:glycosyltransferase involved in cell wall biosynthesis
MIQTKIAVIFPKDSEALFNKDSSRTFGGASAQMYLIAKELANIPSIDCYSIIPHYKKINFKDAPLFTLISAYYEKSNFVLRVLSFVFTLIRVRPAIIIQHGLTPFSGILAFFSKIVKIKFIYMFASDVEVKGLSQEGEQTVKFFKQLIKYTTLLISQNEFQKKYLSMSYGKYSLKLYNGFAIQNGKSEKDGTVLWVGRCVKSKRPELFLKLALRFPKSQFVMICPRSIDTKLFDAIKSQALSLTNVKFLDFVPFAEIQQYYNKSSIFISTSEKEGYPQTFIQSFIAATPVVTMSNIDPDNLITTNDLGSVCNSYTQLEQEVEILLNNIPMLQRKSTNAYSFAKKNHSIEENVRKLLSEITIK